MFDWFDRQTFVTGWYFPIDIEVSLAIHRNDTFDPLTAAQRDPTLRKIYVGVSQIEAQLLCGKHYTHVPDSFFGKGLGFPRHSGRKIIAAEIHQIEISFIIDWKNDLFAIRSRQ